jgi:hypothetical protein
MAIRSLLFCGIIVSFFNAAIVPQVRANTLIIVWRTPRVSFIAADSKLAKASGRDIGL